MKKSAITADDAPATIGRVLLGWPKEERGIIYIYIAWIMQNKLCAHETIFNHYH